MKYLRLALLALALSSTQLHAADNWKNFAVAANKWHISDQYNIMSCALNGSPLESQISAALTVSKIGWLFGSNGKEARSIAHEAFADQQACVQEIFKQHQAGLFQLIKEQQQCTAGTSAMLQYSKWWAKHMSQALRLKVKSEDSSVMSKEKWFRERASKHFNQTLNQVRC